MVSMADTVDERMKSRINIVHAANTADRLSIYIWVKNVGSTKIAPVDDCDIFFGQEDDFARIPGAAEALGGSPNWDYEIEKGDQWDPKVTVKITITYTVDPGAGTYYIKVVLPNGITEEYYFTM